MSDETRPVKSGPSRREKVLLIFVLISVGGLMLLASLYNSATPDLAAIRAVEQAIGADGRAVQVSGRYRFQEIDGSFATAIQLACGSVLVDREPRSFAALVRRRGGRQPRFTVDELAVQPPESRPLLNREAQLLGACQG